jgi:hypothetical protein
MRTTLSVLALTAVLSTAAGANDWPGLWGASRTAVATGDLRSARGQVEVAWRRPVAGGYSEIAVANGRAFTLELRDGVDYIVALDAATGRQHWSLRIGPSSEPPCPR